MARNNADFMEALALIARDKGLAIDTLLESLANALVAAYKRMPGAAEEAFVTIDPDSGEIHVFGQELNEDGDVVKEWEDTPADFGRIAAQTAKQVMFQKIRDAERDLKYDEYAGREGDVVTGIVQQTDSRYTLIDLGRVEALMPQMEQAAGERYEHGSRLKAYIVEVRKTAKGPLDPRAVVGHPRLHQTTLGHLPRHLHCGQATQTPSLPRRSIPARTPSSVPTSGAALFSEQDLKPVRGLSRGDRHSPHEDVHAVVSIDRFRSPLSQPASQ